MLHFEFKKTLKRRETIALMTISIYPLLIALLSRLTTGVVKFNEPAMGAMEFTAKLLHVQDMIMIPVLSIVLLGGTTFYQEIRDRQVYFYKDIPRRCVLNTKYICLYGTYLLFLICYTASCFVAYYLLFKQDGIATGQFYNNGTDILVLLSTAFGIVLSRLFLIHIGITCSLSLRTSISLFIVLLSWILMRVINILPNLRFVSLFLPYYENRLMSEGSNVVYSFAFSATVWIVYNVLLFKINHRRIERMDF